LRTARQWDTSEVLGGDAAVTFRNQSMPNVLVAAVSTRVGPRSNVTADSAVHLLGRLLVQFLPLLERLRPRLNAGEVGIDAVGPRRVAGLLRGDFLPFGLFLGAAFLTLTLALALLL
jgi:hypothetical protein